MNLLCIKCGRGFSVTADQFGTRGKCPHCNATVLVPHLQPTGRVPTASKRNPHGWMDRSFSGFVALGIHLLVLALLAMTPWKRPPSGAMGSGEEVQIGTQPRQRLLQSQLEQLELRSQESRLDAQEMQALDIASSSSLAESMLEYRHAGSSVGGSLDGMTDDLPIQLLDGEGGGGQEAFTEMLSRLEKEGLDLVILFDSTGSMGGEISQVKNQIRNMGGVLRKLVPQMRIGICTYRDRGDEYVVKGLPLTDNLGEVVGFLSEIEAAGGGDEPESVAEGIRWVLGNNDFRPSARKVVLIFGDAPPHYSSQLDCLKMATDFRRTGGVISTVTCRNSKKLEAFVEIAQLGGGEAFLTTDQRQIMSRLVVLVFGSQHQEKVLELFRLLDQ